MSVKDFITDTSVIIDPVVNNCAVVITNPFPAFIARVSAADNANAILVQRLILYFACATRPADFPKTSHHILATILHSKLEM